MRQLNIYEVKTHFSKVVEQVHNGETIIIAKSGKPWAKIIPYDEPKKPFQFGTMKGHITVMDDFDAPLPDEIINLFEKGDHDEL
jgi:prevent-host-death family protein